MIFAGTCVDAVGVIATSIVCFGAGLFIGIRIGFAIVKYINNHLNRRNKKNSSKGKGIFKTASAYPKRNKS